MNTRVLHAIDEYVDVLYDDRQLFRYVYQPHTPPTESPRPYFHPMHTLAGNEVTIYRPHDHLWHTGLSMTCAQLSGENFWGGPTYVRDKGYVSLENNGRVQHRAWRFVGTDGDLPRMVEFLEWISHDEDVWIDEEREIAVEKIDAGGGYWVLYLRLQLRNVTTEPLVFGSPTTQGRPLAGYGGLFWRGPRDFLNGGILADGGLEGPDIMGKPSPWLAYIGKHDGSGESSTVLLADGPSNPRYPNKWFVRSNPYACASCAFMFDEELTLPPGDTLTLTYRVALGNGTWDRQRIEEVHRSLL